MTRPNIYSAEFEYADADPPGYRAAEAQAGGLNIGKVAGGEQLAVRLYELPVGESLCPYHYEYAEEWLLVVKGELDLRTPSGTERITSGDIACFPAGPGGGHKVTAVGDQPVRVMMWSVHSNPEVCVYADSDKVGVYTDNEKDNFMFFRKHADAAYYEGETDAG